MDADDRAPVFGRWVFYNNSSFDGKDANATAQDDGAIATDKSALLPGQKASFKNYTSYSRGINGMMVDVQGLAAVRTARRDRRISRAFRASPSISTITSMCSTAASSR